jgi:hypothetical protein
MFHLQQLLLKPTTRRIAGQSPAMGFIFLFVAGLKANCCKSCPQYPQKKCVSPLIPLVSLLQDKHNCSPFLLDSTLSCLYYNLSLSSYETKPNEILDLLERVKEIQAQVPTEEWDKLPHDGSINHDHYLYGFPKVEA